MTVRDGSELYCMGYAAFRNAYHTRVIKQKEDPETGGKSIKEVAEGVKQLSLQATVSKTSDRVLNQLFTGRRP